MFACDDCKVENVVGVGAFTKNVNVIVCEGALTVYPFVPPQLEFPIIGRNA
jgi:hypothetical protein